jgi:hypothetical protein
MRKMVVTLALTLALAVTVEAGYRVVRLTEVIALAREGVSDRTIISFLENRELGFVVGTEEILRLREAGVGEEVIRYLIERTPPRESYAPEPYANRSPYSYDDRSPYDEPPYEGAYLEYGPSYEPSYYVGAAIGSYLTYNHYYGGGLGGWLARTLGFGHHSRGYYYGRYDRDRDRGRHYSYRYSYGGGSSHGYRVNYGRQSGYGYRASSYGREHAVRQGPSGGRYGGGHTRGSGGHAPGRGRH